MLFPAKLQRFIHNSGTKKYLLAAEIGVTSAMISRYLHNGIMPGYWTARKINEITQNYITMADMGF